MATQQSKTPGDIFQEKFGKICPLIGKRENFNTVTGNFFEKKLLAKKKLDQIDSQPNLNDEERGREVAKSLLEKINEDEDQAAQCLLKICDVFQSKDVDNEPLRKIGASMREKLSTKANQTSGHQGKKIDKDNGHDETDSGSQDGATQPPKQDSEKKKSDEPQATQNSKQKDKESGDEETDGPAEAPPEWSYDKKIADCHNYEDKDFSEDLVEGMNIYFYQPLILKMRQSCII